MNSCDITNESGPVDDIWCDRCQDEVTLTTQTEFLTHELSPRSRQSLEALDPTCRTDLEGLGIGAADVDPLLDAALARQATLLIGPDGSRFISVVKRILTFLGPLSEAESWVNHLLQPAANGELRSGRPFRAPHHTASHQALFAARDRVGEVALASYGILYLDHVEAFPERHLKLLEAVCRHGYVVEGAAGSLARMPATAWPVGARHHCYCGGWGALTYAEDAAGCSCTDEALDAFGRATDANDPNFRHCFHVAPADEAQR